MDIELVGIDRINTHVSDRINRHVPKGLQFIAHLRLSRNQTGRLGKTLGVLAGREIGNVELAEGSGPRGSPPIQSPCLQGNLPQNHDQMQDISLIN
jgi:hypothetical protein